MYCRKRQIQDLAHHLNLTATRVQIHDKMLYNLTSEVEQDGPLNKGYARHDTIQLVGK